MLTLSKVYSATAPSDAPSTITSLISYPSSGTILTVRLSPLTTDTFPFSMPSAAILPPCPASAVMSKCSISVNFVGVINSLSNCGAPFTSTGVKTSVPVPGTITTRSNSTVPTCKVPSLFVPLVTTFPASIFPFFSDQAILFLSLVSPLRYVATTW